MLCAEDGQLASRGLGGNMSKLPVRETKTEILSPKIQAGLTLLQGLLPAMTAIIGGLYVYSTHIQDQLIQQGRAAQTRSFEAKKSFFDKQLTLYGEVARIVGLLATQDPDGPDWPSTKAKFYSIYWSELSMIEDLTVESSMVDYEKTLRKFAAHDTDHQEVRRRGYCLIQVLRSSISRSWDVDLNPDRIAAKNNPRTPSRADCISEPEQK